MESSTTIILTEKDFLSATYQDGTAVTVKGNVISTNLNCPVVSANLDAQSSAYFAITL